MKLVDLLGAAVLVEEFEDSLSVVQDLHHGLASLCDLIHHQLTALHVTLRRNDHDSQNVFRNLIHVLADNRHFCLTPGSHGFPTDGDMDICKTSLCHLYELTDAVQIVICCSFFLGEEAFLETR